MPINEDDVVLVHEDTITPVASDQRIVRAYNLETGDSRLLIAIEIDGIKPKRNDEPVRLLLTTTPLGALQLGEALVELAEAAAGYEEQEQQP